MFSYTVLYSHPVKTLYKSTGIIMSALLKHYKEPSDHYWMLWVAPTASQKQSLSKLSTQDRQRCLMLHPKNNNHLMTALETAVISGLYQTITLPKHIINQHQGKQLEIMAIRHNTHLVWVKDQQPTLNSASQLRLL